MSATSNPAGSPKVTDLTPSPKRPSEEVQQAQDSQHTEADFIRDLNRATRRKPS